MQTCSFYMCSYKVGVLLLTVGLHAVTQLGLHLAVGPVAPLLGQLPRHGGGRHDRLRGRSLATRRDNQWTGSRQVKGRADTQPMAGHEKWLLQPRLMLFGMVFLSSRLLQRKKICDTIWKCIGQSEGWGSYTSYCVSASVLCVVGCKNTHFFFLKVFSFLKRWVEPQLYIRNGRSHRVIGLSQD